MGMIRLFGHDWITSVEVAHSTLPLELPLPHYRGSGGSGTKDDVETTELARIPFENALPNVPKLLENTTS